MEEFSKTQNLKQEEFQINPKTGMIMSEGHEYLNIPRMQELIRRANKIREILPAVSPGYTRLWRGNRSDEVGKNPSFTSSLEGIALPFLGVYGGVLTYVDVPNEDLNKYLNKIGTAPNSEFKLPPDLARQAKIVNE